MFTNPFSKVFYATIGPSGDGPGEPTPSVIPEETSIDRIIKYCTTSPHNTNPAILLQLIRDIDDTDLAELRGTNTPTTLTPVAHPRD